MELYVTRHGQTAWNAEKRICGGCSDISLSNEGREQARELGQCLSEISLDRVLISPLLRARETAEIALRGRKISIQIEDRLIEHRFGVMEGVPIDDKNFTSMRWNPAYCFPGRSESLFQVVARVYPLLDELHSSYSDESVLLVCHGGIARIIKSYFEPMDDESFRGFRMPNCGLLHFTD